MDNMTINRMVNRRGWKTRLVYRGFGHGDGPAPSLGQADGYAALDMPRDDMPPTLPDTFGRPLPLGPQLGEPGVAASQPRPGGIVASLGTGHLLDGHAKLHTMTRAK